MSLLFRQLTHLVKSPASICFRNILHININKRRLSSEINTNNTSSNNDSNNSRIKVNFRRSNGQVLVGNGKEGDTLLDVVVNNNLDLDGFGACEGTLACSTCHLILKKEDYDRLPKKPLDEELDMLDLAYGLTDTSRLGCQIYLTQDMHDMEVQVPEGVNDVRS